MKRMTVGAILGMVCLMVFSGTALAADTAGKFGVGVELGYNKVADSGFPNSNAVDVEPEGAFIFGATGSYFFTDYFSMEMTVDYTKTDIDLSGSGVSVGFGELSQVPWLLTARLHYPNQSMISPYLGGGVGYYFNSFDTDSVFYNVGKTDFDVENSFGFHVNGGAEIFATENIAIDMDLKYTWTAADFEAVQRGRSLGEEEIDLDAFTVTAGLKYYF